MVVDQRKDSFEFPRCVLLGGAFFHLERRFYFDNENAQENQKLNDY